MPITNIKQVINMTPIPIWVLNMHDNLDTGPAPGTKVLPPTQNSDGSTTLHPFVHDMWVPWAPAASDFAAGKQHIYINDGGSPGSAYFCLWQALGKDGDHVRFSAGGCQWTASGGWVPGINAVGGDRTLMIAGQPGALTLSVDPYKPPPTATGNGGATLIRVGFTNQFAGTCVGPPADSTINGRVRLTPVNSAGWNILAPLKLAKKNGAEYDLTPDSNASDWYTDLLVGTQPAGTWITTAAWDGADPGIFSLALTWGRQ